MPRTRSQIKENSDWETNHNPILVKISTNNCAALCKKKYEDWFKEDKFNVHRKCPCILSLCKDCSEESYTTDEYCPLDIHDSFLEYVESECSGADKETTTINLEEITKRIIFDLNGEKITCHAENAPDGTDGAEEEKENAEDIPLTNYPTVSNHQSNNNVHCNFEIPTVHQTNNVYYKTSVFVILVAVICGAVYYYAKSPVTVEVETRNKTDVIIENVFHKLNGLERTYTRQPKDLWASLRVGMRKLVIQNNSPTTILLLHSQNSTVNRCLLKKIRDITIDIAFQQNEVASIPKGKGVYINMEDYLDVFTNPGEFMEKYKFQLAQDKLMIVENFHKSSMTVMEAFHYLSDTIDPWVKNVLIILTLEINIPKRASQNNENIAERKLRELLKSLPDNVSDPLITRLTENVFMVADEAIDSSCSLF